MKRLIIIFFTATLALAQEIPTPEKFLGFKVGTEKKLARWDKIVDYMQTVGRNSDRMKLLELGKSTNGNPFIMMVVSSPSNLKNLEHHREVNRRLFDPRRISSDDEARNLIQEAKLFVLITCSIHATEIGATPKEDMHALWRRLVFSILISNTDDHLRNHGFLWAGPAGWRLSPAYDLNPAPTDIKPRILTTAIDLEDGTASLRLALQVAGYFELGEDEAQKIAAQVGQAVATWRKAAAKLRLTPAEIDRMASAFEHEDLKAALALLSHQQASNK